jgi:hypothetical protein
MDKTKRLETVLVIVLGLVAIYWFKKHNALLVAAIVIGVSALLVPAAAQGIHWCWMQLSRIMGAVSGRVLLTVVYVLVLLPMAVVARWSGKGNLRMKAGGDSYFKERNHTYTKEDIIHPW